MEWKGFKPLASSSQRKCSIELNYAPLYVVLYREMVKSVILLRKIQILNSDRLFLFTLYAVYTNSTASSTELTVM